VVESLSDICISSNQSLVYNFLYTVGICIKRDTCTLKEQNERWLSWSFIPVPFLRSTTASEKV